MRVSLILLVRIPTSSSDHILHVVLGLLCVHPDHQRQGAGRELVQWGLRQAADLGLTVHLEASPEGIPLYRSLGFEIVETITVNAGEWDGGFERRYIVMLWKPASTISNNAHSI
jgi:ribosomal protein S18 acetylase RimI-like enzyme